RRSTKERHFLTQLLSRTGHGIQKFMRRTPTVTPRSRLSESILDLMLTTPDLTCCGPTPGPVVRSYATIVSQPSGTKRLKSPKEFLWKFSSVPLAEVRALGS